MLDKSLKSASRRRFQECVEVRSESIARDVITKGYPTQHYETTPPASWLNQNQNIIHFLYIYIISENNKEVVVDTLILLSKYIVGGDGEREKQAADP
ncbi:MAG: hypothetical protein N3G75_06220, partial [Methanothrix sp.]